MTSLWTLAEDKVLRSMFGRENYAQIGEKVGRSESAIKKRAQRLGLAEYCGPRKAISQRLTHEHQAYIRQQGEVLTDREMADFLGRSVNQVQAARLASGVRRPRVSNGGANAKAKPTPTRPKGYTAAQIAEAKATPNDQQSRHILAVLGLLRGYRADPAYMRGSEN